QQLGHILEPRESLFWSVGAALRGDLQSGDDLAEGAGPGIEVTDPELLQDVWPHIAGHGVQFGHGVSDGGAGGKYHSPAAVQLADITAFHPQVKRLGRTL